MLRGTNNASPQQTLINAQAQATPPNSEVHKTFRHQRRGSMAGKSEHVLIMVRNPPSKALSSPSTSSLSITPSTSPNIYQVQSVEGVLPSTGATTTLYQSPPRKITFNTSNSSSSKDSLGRVYQARTPSQRWSPGTLSTIGVKWLKRILVFFKILYIVYRMVSAFEPCPHPNFLLRLGGISRVSEPWRRVC